ncbi:C-C chemokine receptor type 10 [Megalops cyprinoides]|uniref:C-C chemokine receptor type 10 n=1 Tax=Megalops cyprinoides TaxID=118141 RepID=UPI001863FCE9|nr:C-C chemokine receptor type 10 [Megalops cyprinoides]
MEELYSIPEDYYDDASTVTLDYSSSTGVPEICESSNSQELHIKIFQTCIFIVVLLLGVLGNSLVIATFVLYRRLRLRCMTDVFLLHLAGSDLLLLLTIPLQAADLLLGSWEFGTVLCKATRALYAINTYSGLLLLACISADRYIVIVQAHAAHRMRRRTLLYSKVAALCVWVVALLLSLPEIIFTNVDKRETGGLKQCEMYVWVKESWRVKMATRGAQITGFCLPFLVMLVCYSLIGRALMQGRSWRRQRTLRLMVALVVVFVLFQLPYTVVLSVKAAGPPGTCHQWGTLLLAEYSTRSLAYTRCCLNPLLYALVGVRFRNDVLKLLHDMGCPCAAHLGPPVDSCSSGSPASTFLSPTPSITAHSGPIIRSPTAKAPLSPSSPNSFHYAAPPALLSHQHSA